MYDQELYKKVDAGM
jgi:hypothetical protein